MLLKLDWQEFLARAAEFFGFSPDMLYRLLWTAAVLLVWVLLRGVLGALAGRHITDDTRRYHVVKTFQTLAALAALIALLKLWFGGVSGLGAYLGIVSAGLAIALQEPLQNLAGWVFIALRKPFKVGDRVEIGRHKGDVIDKNLFQFTLVEVGNWVQAEQSTGRILRIPNGVLFREPLANYTEGFNYIWNEIAVVVTFESDWRRAKKLLQDLAIRHGSVAGDKAAREIRKTAARFMIFFRNVTPIVWTSVVDHGVKLTMRYLCEPRQRRSSESEIWEDVLDAFAKEAHVDFAYPTKRTYVLPEDRVAPALDPLAPHAVVAAGASQPSGQS